MKSNDTRRQLIDGTIRVIARDGLDKATTKQIGIETATNEAYIYRCFHDKTDMFAQTFDCLDNELLDTLMQHVSIMYMQTMDFEMRCWGFFSSVWKFILGNQDRCLAYIQYYYSPYFKKHSAEIHKRRYAPLLEQFRPAFREEANVWMLLNHILNVMLDFAIKVFDGALPDNEDTAEHVFRLLYVSVRQYFNFEM